ncbi:MAG: glycosyltransferase family 39 protein [Rhodomicrobium sp.]
MSSFSPLLTASPALSSQPASAAKAQAAAWLFGVLAAIFLAWPVWRIGFQIEIGRNEPWNAWFIDAVLNGTALYPSRDELIVNNYPPLSFYFVALVSKLTGDTIFAGRLISLVSTLVVSFGAGYCIRALGGSRGAAAFGGFWLLATLSHFFTRHVGVNDPSMLALALMVLALALFLDRVRASRAVEPAIALMVLAGFTKHNLPAFPLAALIWLAMNDKRAALRAAAFGASLCAAGLLLCTTAFGPQFAEQMLMPRVISVGHMLSTVNKLQWIAPALMFWGLWAWANRKAPAAQFTALLLGLSLTSGLFQAAGAGVIYNAYFEVVVASAIAAAIAFVGIGRSVLAKRYGTDALQTAMISVLVLRLMLSQQLEHYLVFTSPSFWAEEQQNLAAFNAEVARVESIPGPVSCSMMSVCYRAGKAFVYDRFWMPQLIAKGEWTRSAVDHAILDRGIQFEVIDQRAAPKKKRLF